MEEQRDKPPARLSTGPMKDIPPTKGRAPKAQVPGLAGLGVAIKMFGGMKNNLGSHLQDGILLSESPYTLGCWGMGEKNALEGCRKGKGIKGGGTQYLAKLGRQGAGKGPAWMRWGGGEIQGVVGWEDRGWKSGDGEIKLVGTLLGVWVVSVWGGKWTLVFQTSTPQERWVIQPHTTHSLRRPWTAATVFKAAATEVTSRPTLWRPRKRKEKGRKLDFLVLFLLGQRGWKTFFPHFFPSHCISSCEALCISCFAFNFWPNGSFVLMRSIHSVLCISFQHKTKMTWSSKNSSFLHIFCPLSLLENNTSQIPKPLQTTKLTSPF